MDDKIPTSKETWQGRAVFILAVTFGLSVTSAVIGASTGVLEFRQDGAVWVGTALGVCLGVVVTYVGGRLFQRRNGGDS